MSTRIFAAVIGMGVAACLAGPAEARLDNGPISSLYENDGRKLTRQHTNARPSARRNTQVRRGKQARRAAQSRRAGSNSRARNRGAQSRNQARRSGASSRNRTKVAARAVTAGRSGGGGASRSCLTPAARGLLNRIESQFGPVQVISTCRPGAKIRNTGRPSRHASGNAVDFNAGGRKQAIVNWLRANHHSGGTMTYARMSHIHVDIGPRFVSLNHGGGRRRS